MAKVPGRGQPKRQYDAKNREKEAERWVHNQGTGKNRDIKNTIKSRMSPTTVRVFEDAADRLLPCSGQCDHWT